MLQTSVLCVQANSAMHAREVTIFCPFLVVNKTHVPLRVIDSAPLAETSSIAPPLPEDNIAQPLLFRYPRHAFLLLSCTPLFRVHVSAIKSGRLQISTAQVPCMLHDGFGFDMSMRGSTASYKVVHCGHAAPAEAGCGWACM